MKTPLEKLDTISPDERHAFLALFSAGQRPLTVFEKEDTGEQQPVNFGKCECEAVPFDSFWCDKIPALGFITLAEDAPTPALGMPPGWTFKHVTIDVTEEGLAAREAYWERFNKRCDEG